MAASNDFMLTLGACPSPLLRGSARLRPPTALTPRPADPHGQRCEEGYSRWWWRHPGEPYAVGAAGQSLSFQAVRQYGAGSGPPSSKGESSG